MIALISESIPNGVPSLIGKVEQVFERPQALIKSRGKRKRAAIITIAALCVAMLNYGLLSRLMRCAIPILFIVFTLKMLSAFCDSFFSLFRVDIEVELVAFLTNIYHVTRFQLV